MDTDFAWIAFAVVGSAVALASAVIAMFSKSRTNDTERRAMESAAQELGFDPAQVHLWGDGLGMNGMLGDVPVEVEPVIDRRGKSNVRTIRFLARGSPISVAFKRQGLAEDIAAILTGEDYQTGDEEFDRNVVVRGDSATLSACLDRTTRRAVLHFVVGAGGTVRDGTVVLDEPAGSMTTFGIVSNVRLVADLARKLRLEPDQLSERLARVAAEDTDSGVRLVALGRLVERRDALAAPALQRALSDPSLTVRLYAARRGGERGAEVIRAALLDPRTPPDYRTDCLQYLSHAKYRPLLEPHLVKLSHDGEPRVRAAAIRVLPLAGDIAFQVLIGLADSADVIDQEAAVSALGGMQDSRAEDVLIGLLSSESARVRLAAATALGSCGTVRAVEPLLRRTDGLFDNAEKEAARLSIATIQERAGDVEAGGLSLAEPRAEEGGLSVADRTGALSLARSTEKR